MSEIKGKISSFHSAGTVDGPGVRYVVFMQGCSLRCIYCHNPETWDMNGEEYTVDEVLSKVLRYRSYFKEKGGITISGGEPLLQVEFVTELLKRCKDAGINTAIDTAGNINFDKVSRLLEFTDLVLLDIKFTTEEEYFKYTGGSLKKTLKFLDLCNSLNIPVWIRQVIVPEINDNIKKIKELAKIIKKYDNIKKVELLPFKKLCIEKYDSLGIEFPLRDVGETSTKVLGELSCEFNKE